MEKRGKRKKANSRLDFVIRNNILSKSKHSNSHSEFLFNNNLLNSKRSTSHSEFLFNNNLLNSKRSQEGIISVVLLILIVIAASVIVIAFIIPFIKDKLSSGDCINVATKVKISSSAYTCYKPTPDKKMQVQISIGDVRDLIDGFTIELGGPSSQSFKITNGTTVTGITMYGGGLQIEIPGDNEERTYIFNNIQNKPESLKVYPILKTGKSCDASDATATVEDC